jgi:hypothetical protein
MQSLLWIHSYFSVATHEEALQFGFVSTFFITFFFLLFLSSNSLVIHSLVVFIWLPADFLSSVASSHILHQRRNGQVEPGTECNQRAPKREQKECASEEFSNVTPTRK